MALRRKRAHHPLIGDTLPKTENQSFAGVTSAAVLDSAKCASRPNLILAICCVSLLIVGMDVTIVNVALPAIQKDLHARLAGLQWILDAYTLVVASFLMLAGSMADRFGRRRVLQIGLWRIFCFSHRAVHATVGCHDDRVGSVVGAPGRELWNTAFLAGFGRRISGEHGDADRT